MCTFLDDTGDDLLNLIPKPLLIFRHFVFNHQHLDVLNGGLHPSFIECVSKEWVETGARISSGYVHVTLSSAI